MTPSTSPEISQIAERINSLPILKLFGAKVTFAEPGEAEVVIAEVRDFHTGGLETSAINGMTLMGLMDAAMCAAALSTLQGKKCATGEMSVKFLKPVFGQSIMASGKVISRTKNVFSCEASILDSEGLQRATAVATVHVI